MSFGGFRSGMSSTAAKKRQEERLSKEVRELSHLPANKYCFECGQRGPTYVNITHGSFCCMHCSGILRGLNPPHRVKSISMATFTQEEVEKLRSSGNDENAKIWLGLHDGPVKFEPVRLDDAVKQHLIEKYERRRWYVSPDDIAEQKRLLAAHTRRDSASGLSVLSNKSNQSAPANLHPIDGSIPIPSSGANGFANLLGDDFMFPPLAEQPQQPHSQPNSVRSTPFVPPPLSVHPNPLSSHNATPAPLQFDLFANVKEPTVETPVAPVSDNAGLNLFGSAPAPAPAPTVQSNFANFDTVFENLSISSNEPSATPVASVFPGQGTGFAEPVNVKPVEPENKDDGLPDYSALDAIYNDHNEPIDFFGFAKATPNPPHHTGPAKSSTIGDFGSSPPFPPTANSSNPSHLSTSPFLSMNAFPHSSSTSAVPSEPAPWERQPTASDQPWGPAPTTGTGTAADAKQWNPFS
uniref:Arf-GAP domain-containing protein n=1 Tax=Panagrellus redivivus TaxID=6233 RepID=A0A7E4VFK6_PANRE